MSIQKKSLISTLQTTKKANVASAPMAEAGGVKSVKAVMARKVVKATKVVKAAKVAKATKVVKAAKSLKRR